MHVGRVLAIYMEATVAQGEGGGRHGIGLLLLASWHQAQSIEKGLSVAFKMYIQLTESAQAGSAQLLLQSIL